MNIRSKAIELKAALEEKVKRGEKLTEEDRRALAAAGIMLLSRKERRARGVRTTDTHDVVGAMPSRFLSKRERQRIRAQGGVAGSSW